MTLAPIVPRIKNASHLARDRALSSSLHRLTFGMIVPPSGLAAEGTAIEKMIAPIKYGKNAAIDSRPATLLGRPILRRHFPTALCFSGTISAEGKPAIAAAMRSPT
jgi:hypothetical protein